MLCSARAILLFLFFCLGGSALAQNYWMQRGGSATADEGMDISIDGAGNTYTTGYYSSAVTFGLNTTITTSGVSDIFVTKTDPSGNIVWAIGEGGSGPDRGLSIKADALGNTVVTGYFSGTATFGSTTLTSAGNEDVFIAKYDNAGSLLWARSAGGPSSDIGNAVNIDINGNVLVTGQFSGSAQFGTVTLTSQSGSIDVFTAKYDAAGNFVWVEQGSAPQTDRGLDVSADAQGNVYVTGQFSDTITFDQVHNNNMLNAIFLIKYNSSGVEQWFRRIGGGTVNISYALVTDASSNVYITGDFSGNLIFFTTPTFTLAPPNTNNIFLAKFNSSGGLLWAEADGSASEVSARNLTIDNAGDPYITGTFKCTFDEYAAQYGQGTFNSIGFNDIYVVKYNSSGVRQWMRQCGGQLNDYGAGIAADSNGDAYIAGSFNRQINFASNSSYLMPQLSFPDTLTITQFNYSAYCSDPDYGEFISIAAVGSSDIIIAKAFDLNRAPYDFYMRTGTGCNPNVVSACILSMSNDYFHACPDTIHGCGSAVLNAATNTSAFSPGLYSPGPDWTYLWSTGATTKGIIAYTSGNYYVTLTSADGCFTSIDTVYAFVHPPPPNPTITDDQGVNINAVNTQPVLVCADSVLLTGGNFNGNYHVWSSFYDPNDTSTVYTVDTTGWYFLTVIDAYGCSNTSQVYVELSDPLDSIVPGLALLNDIDGNDTLSICANSAFTIAVFDSLASPPPPPYQCITYANAPTTWTVTPNVAHSGTCYTFEDFYVPQSGDYTVNVMFIRRNVCDTDTVYLSKTVHIDILPLPVVNLNVPSLVQICPGDTAMIVATGAMNYTWNGPNAFTSSNDTIYTTIPGEYIISGSTTDSSGCTETVIDTVTLIYTPPPLITMNPASGLICPNSSVILTCSGTGSFQWYGPQGQIPGNTSSITVTTAGFYYCIVTDPTGCALLSNTVELTQYATPFILAMPTSVICPGDSLTLNIITGDSSIVNWQSPLSGSAPSQVVSQPGTYTVSVMSCNILTNATISILPAPAFAQITPLSASEFCEGDSVVLAANAGMSSYLWSNGSTNDTLVVFDAGTYSLVTTDTSGCTDTSSAVTVSVVPNTLASPIVSNDTTICTGQSVVLQASSTDNIYWYNSAGAQIASGSSYSTPALTATTAYYIVTADSFCKSEETIVTVTVDDCVIGETPNVFSPNGDGINDLFMIDDTGAEQLRCRIYNRWGRLIYEFGLNEGWPGTIMQSGKPAEDGVYYYILDITDYVGTSTTDHGFVQLVR